MVLRVFGLKMEENYGETVDWENYEPDFHQEVESGNFKLNDEPILSSGGSRSYKTARAGVMKPTGSTSGNVDLQRIGHYFRALLDNYNYTSYAGGISVHEFWGGDNSDLASFSGVQTYDIFQKQLVGLLLNSMKLSVSDEYMTFENEWIYKDESSDTIDASEYEKIEAEGDIPLMFYDVSIKLNNQSTGIQNSFEVEIKNNLNQDKTIGLGSRRPQKKANAGLREINLSLTTVLDSTTLNTILAGEYGQVGATSPTACRIYKVPLELDVDICEDNAQFLRMKFPACTLKVEYDLSGTDDIETTITLVALGTGQTTLDNSSETVNTDVYIKLVNYTDEITIDEE